MRTMTHHGRGKGRAGHTFGTKHNDRDFDIQNAHNIDAQLTHENLVWHCYMDEPETPEVQKEEDEKLQTLYCPMNWRLQGMIDEATGTNYAAENKAKYFAKKNAAEGKTMTFEQAEVRFYEEHFSEQLKETNDKYRANGHPERCKSMAAWKQARRNAPEESLYQIGDKHVTGEHADVATLKACYDEFELVERRWNDEHGNPFTVLNRAVHVDEPECPPHVHVRKVWHYKTEDGVLHLGQEEALKRAGIELPNPDQKVSRYNNRKMVYDAMMREEWLKVLERHGIEVEKVPLPGRKRKGSRTHEKYLEDKYNAMAQEAEKQAQRAAEAESRADAAEAKLKGLEEKIEALEDDLAVQKKAHEEQLELNAAHEKVIEENDAIIQDQEHALGLIKDYAHYCAVAEITEEDLEVGESMMQMLPPPKGIFKPAQQKEWSKGMKTLLQKLMVSIADHIRRMQIYEVLAGITDRRSEPAQKRADSLNDMIENAFSRTEAAPDKGQTREMDEPSR